MNTVSPKYNTYNNFNNTNKQQYNQQPSFGANTDEVVIKVVKKSNFLKKTITAIKSVPPLEAFPYNAITIAIPFKIPPKTETDYKVLSIWTTKTVKELKEGE